MSDVALEDYQWLIGPEAEHWLALATQSGEPQGSKSQSGKSLLSLAKALRAKLSTVRAHLVLEQVDLRRRAADKFAHAEAMFFTSTLLQQASGDAPARYKAERFAAGSCLADLCCGLGGDLLALADRGPIVGVDRDAVAVLLAQSNCRAEGLGRVDIRRAVADSFDLSPMDAWHIDPDRRTDGRRTTKMEFFSPARQAIDRLLAVNPNAAVKLAPATEAPRHWAEQAQLEWIGHVRQCRQQVAWFGTLACHPGCRSATILTDGAPPRTVVGQSQAEIPYTANIGRFLIEPHAAVLAAGLAAELARQHSLAAFSPDVAYLSGDEQIDDAALALFAVTDVLPFDQKRLKSLLRQRGIGRLEVKKRCVELDPQVVRKQLQVPGDQSATLLLAPLAGRVTAILAQRQSQDCLSTSLKKASGSQSQKPPATNCNGL